jgi:hypothetical protein
MAHRLPQRAARWALGAAMVIAASAPAGATCTQVRALLSQGLSVGEVAAELGAPIGFVQACLQPRVLNAPVSRQPAAGPPPLGAAGPAPHGAAGPAPHGAAGPAPHGAPGPAPHGAPGPPPLGAAGP